MTSSSPPSPPDVLGGLPEPQWGSGSDPSSALRAETRGRLRHLLCGMGDDNLDLSKLQQGFQETRIMEAQVNKHLSACGGVRLVLMARR